MEEEVMTHLVISSEVGSVHFSDSAVVDNKIEVNQKATTSTCTSTSHSRKSTTESSSKSFATNQSPSPQKGPENATAEKS